MPGIQLWCDMSTPEQANFADAENDCRIQLSVHPEYAFIEILDHDESESTVPSGRSVT